MKPYPKSAGHFSPAFLFNRCRLHPATKIAAFILIAILIPHLKVLALFGLAFILSFALIHFRVKSFISTMLRMRWLMLSLLLIYAYTTPGEYLPYGSIDWAPTYEGVREGLIQVLRICLVLASISLLMATSKKESLMAGIYTIIKPLRFLSVTPERFTARLYLTLHYIEDTKKQKKLQDQTTSWQEKFQASLYQSQEVLPSEKVYLEVPRFALVDGICIFVLLILIGLNR